LEIVFKDQRADFGDIEYDDTELNVSPTTVEDIYNIDLSHLNNSQQTEFRNLLYDNRGAFSSKPEVCKLIKHRIILIDGFKPVKRAPYSIPHNLVAEVDRQIDLLLAEGKLVPVACTPRRAKRVGIG